LNQRRLACFALAIVAPAAAAQGPYRFPTTEIDGGTYYVIDGKEYPEHIPYYSVWHGEFLYAAMRRTNPGMDRIYAHLKLSAEDRLAFYRAADGQQQRDADCKKRYTAWADEALKARGLTDVQQLFRPQTPAEKSDPLIRELGEKQMAVEIECRAADLRAADELLVRMSPSGRQTLLGWIEERRRGMTERVYVDRMPWFHLPVWQGGRK
jgi:hypothetical protein